MLDGQGYLSVDRVNRWMEGLIAKAITSVRMTSSVLSVSGGNRSLNRDPQPASLQVRTRKSGPAQTLLITMLTDRGEEVELDVDLVPTFVFPIRRLSDHPRVWMAVGKLDPAATETFFVVPKRSAKPAQNPDRAWRMSFPYQEKVYLLEGVPQGVSLKPLIRLMKVDASISFNIFGHKKVDFFLLKQKCRDNNEPLCGISSYALKISAIHLYQETKRRGVDWTEANLPNLFIMLLEKLESCLRSDS